MICVSGTRVCSASPPIEDLYLATACARGEEAAWEECATRFFAFIRGFARRRLRGPSPDEVADQVIADLWQRGKIARFEARSTLRTWLGAVVAHAVANAVKARRPTVSWEDEASREAAQPGLVTAGESREVEAHTAAVLSRLVAQALAERTDEDKLLLLLYYEQGLTLDQIAAAQGSSKSSLSRRLTRLRTEIRSRPYAYAFKVAGLSAAPGAGSCETNRPNSGSK